MFRLVISPIQERRLFARPLKCRGKLRVGRFDGGAGLFVLYHGHLCVFGIRAPRNADQQERVPGRHTELRNIQGAAARYALLNKQAQAGATLHMKNHVMLYLGQNAGKYYAIHDLGSYGDAENPRGDGTLPRVEVMKVVVSELDLPLRSGRRFIEALTSANGWQP